MVISKTYITDL